jgi:predicted CXXCH cytochrome family protein
MTATVLIALLTLTGARPEASPMCALDRIDRARTSSATCLTCHDGSAAPAVDVRATRPRSSHPVGVSYALARPELAVRRAGPVDARIVLPAGRVECVSCHAADGAGAHRTVDAAGGLCGGCHAK